MNFDVCPNLIFCWILCCISHIKKFRLCHELLRHVLLDSPSGETLFHSNCTDPLSTVFEHTIYACSAPSIGNIVRLGPSPKPKSKEKGLDQSRTLNSHSTTTTHPPTTNFLTSSRQPRRVKFKMEAHFNPTKSNLKTKIWGHLTPLPPVLSLNWVKLCNLIFKHPIRLKFDM